MLSQRVDLHGNLGFTLPHDLGDLDPAIESLDLRFCSLIGRILFDTVEVSMMVLVAVAV